MNCELLKWKFSPRSHLDAYLQIIYLTAHCLAKPGGNVNICASAWARGGKIDLSSQDLKKASVLCD